MVLAFLWKHGVMTNLGTVDGDACSAAHSINSKSQVVGESSPSCFNDPTVHAFLWENGGPMVDLNTLIPPGSGIDVAAADSINDRGEISSEGELPNGDNRAVLLIPCDENHPDVEGCDYSTVDSTVGAANVSQAIMPHRAATMNMVAARVDDGHVRVRREISRKLQLPNLASPNH